ncbi:Chaperone protein DnaJ 2 [Astathelohania contejeani]|uniref:Chaperone protein DnaJ 2 n=1 Tax=Astathelohania contejeani TaxID=164912 RepID=A0ABQ7I2P4_9MICR|nr:Chaperone protein DnaJ 2 [Thelohania contejeani]
MDYKLKMEECLAKNDYQGYKRIAEKLYESDPNEENRILYEKASNTLKKYIQIKEFLKKDPRDYYSILNVDEKATEEEIKRSYKRLTMQYHPDITKIQESNEVFQKIQEAYNVLKDSRKRSEYDMRRAYNRNYNNRETFEYSTNNPHFFYDDFNVYRQMYGSTLFGRSIFDPSSAFIDGEFYFHDVDGEIIRTMINNINRRRRTNQVNIIDPTNFLKGMVIIFFIFVLLLFS